MSKRIPKEQRVRREFVYPKPGQIFRNAHNRPIKAIERAGDRNYWLFQCYCGRRFFCHVFDLVHRQKVVSCGCYFAAIYLKESVRTTEVSKSREFNSWFNMIKANGSKQRKDGKPLIDPRWYNFEEFLKDVGYSPENGSSRLLRIVPEGGFYKGNVRWDDRFSQSDIRLVEEPGIIESKLEEEAKKQEEEGI